MESGLILIVVFRGKLHVSSGQREFISDSKYPEQHICSSTHINFISSSDDEKYILLYISQKISFKQQSI